MVTPTKDLDLDALRPRFVTVMSALGSWLTGLRSAPQRPVVEPASTAEPAMIRPSQHERIAIEAHREDRI
jgi:hypothetical protein